MVAVVPVCAAADERELLRRAEAVRRAAPRSTAKLVRAINFGIFGWLVGAAARRAEVAARLSSATTAGRSSLLTILINLAMFPLRHKSVVSMRKMQEIQPQIKAIQDRYANLKVTDPDEAEDEHRGDEPLSREGREPGERLRADAADDAGAVRVLRDAPARRSSCAARRSAAGFTTCRSHDPFYVMPLLMGVDHVLAAADDADDGAIPRSRR